MSDKGAGSNVLLVVAALVIIILLVVGGYVAYNMLLPSVWTETLKVKNSTGQHDIITNYRNATDVSYSDLIAFMNAENATLKATVDLDDTYRPVEYAVRLHDDAQAARINCSLLPLNISDDYPGNVPVAFRTTDTGMVFVDPTAMNVSSDDYPGVAFDSIIFLRDQWNHTLPVTDENDQPVQVREQRNAGPVSYGELLQFLASDATELTDRPDNATSALFAARLHDNAEARGLKSAIVRADFVEEDYFCYFNAFPTTDKDIVYISDRSSQSPDIRALIKPQDTVVYITNESEAGGLPVSLVDGRLDDAFYQSMMEATRQYRFDILMYFQARELLDADIKDYNQRFAVNNDSYNQYLAERAQLDAEKAQYRSNYPNRTTDWPTVVGRSKALDSKYNLYLANVSQLLYEKRALDARQDGLEERFNVLASSEYNKWISPYPHGIQPHGMTLKQIRVFW